MLNISATASTVSRARLCSCAMYVDPSAHKSSFSVLLHCATASKANSLVPVHLPGEVELLKRESRIWHFQHLDSCLHRCGWEFLRLRYFQKLVRTIFIAFAPCYLMGGEQKAPILGVDVKRFSLSHNPGAGFPVIVRDDEGPSLVVHKPVESDLLNRAKIC